MVQQGAGKRRGARKGAPPPRTFRRDVFLLALGTTAAVIAWGYLVYAAIDFGSEGRDGDGRAWAFAGIAALGAAACLFIALLLGARIARALGAAPSPGHGDAPLSSGSAASGRPTGSHQRDR